MNNTITKNDLSKGYEYIKQIIDTYLIANKIEYTSSEIAPNSFKRMKQYKDTFGQFLVYSEGDHGHLGKEYNIKFRALHDFMHLYNNLTFSFADEKKLSDITMREFSAIAWHGLGLTHWECYVIRQIVNAEIKGQIEYFEANKKYVDDQTKFIETYLEVV